MFRININLHNLHFDIYVLYLFKDLVDLSAVAAAVYGS